MPAGRTTAAYNPADYDEFGNYIGPDAAPVPPPDTSMYAAPIEAQYQPGGDKYYVPPDPGAAYGAATGPTQYETVPPPPTDPYNTAPSGTYPSDPIPAPTTPAGGYTGGGASTYYGGVDSAYQLGQGGPNATEIQRIHPGASSNPLDIFRPLVQSGQQALSNLVNTDAAANRQGAARAIQDYHPLGLAAKGLQFAGEHAGDFLPTLFRGMPTLRPHAAGAERLNEATAATQGGDLPVPSHLFAATVANSGDVIPNTVDALARAGRGISSVLGNDSADPTELLPNIARMAFDPYGPQTQASTREVQSRGIQGGRIARAAFDDAGGSLAAAQRLSQQADPVRDAFVNLMNTPLPTPPGASAPDMNDSMLGMSLQAGNDTGAVMRGDMDLNEFGMRQLAAVASNPNAPAPIKAEANRMIGQALAAELAAQPMPWYQGGVDAARRGAQAVRGIDIPTPDLSGASMPDVGMPSFGRPSLGIDLSGIDLSGIDLSGIDLSAPSVSLPEPPPSLPTPDPNALLPEVSVPGFAQEAAAEAQEIPGRLAGSLAALPDLGLSRPDTSGLSKNVLDPLMANSQDNTIFGVDTSGLSLPSFGFNVRDIPPPSLPSVDVQSGLDKGRSFVENAVDAVSDGGKPRLTHTVTRPATTLDPETAAAWRQMDTAALDAMLANNPDQFNTAVAPKAVTGADGTPRKVWVIPGMEGPNGEPYIVGVVQGGVTVPAGEDMDKTTFEALIDGADAAPVSADAVPSPDAAAATAANAAKIAADADADTGTTTKDATIPTPSATSGSSRSSGGQSSGSRSSGGGSYDRSYDRSSSRSYDDGGGSEREFTADDFLDAADGDRKKAAMMARFANKRRRSRGRRGAEESGDGGMWPGFPFNRPPSPIRANILTSLGEAFAQAFPNRRA
jgi:hypothetical protein